LLPFVSVGPGDGRRRRFTPPSIDRLGTWADFATDEDCELVNEALMCVAEDTCHERYPWYADPVHPMTYFAVVRPGLVVSIRYVRDYPTWAQLIYVGPPLF
jgi:hypothetical protein